MGAPPTAAGPDLKQGVDASEVLEGVPLLGQVDGEAVILVRDGGRVHAVGATCTHYGGPLAGGNVAGGGGHRPAAGATCPHYGGPLAEGSVDGGGAHCPWHHACFDLATGREIEARVVPRAVGAAAVDASLRERPAVVRARRAGGGAVAAPAGDVPPGERPAVVSARRADGVHAPAVAHEDHGLAVDLPEQRYALEHLTRVDTLLEIGPGGRRWSSHASLVVGSSSVCTAI